MSKDGKKVIIYFSASGCWTTYTCTGMVWADTSANLLDSRSWHKSKEPAFMSMGQDSIFCANDICIVPSDDPNRPILLYETKQDENKGNLVKQIRIKNISWDKNGFPVLNK